MWTYILGPFLALFPEPWREALAFQRNTDPARAASLSGLLESIGAIVASGYWYMYAMGKLVDRGVDAAASGKLGPAVTDQQISAVALSLWAAHPLTWLLAFFIFEGVIRLCAASFTGSVYGTLPLALFDKILFAPFRRRPPGLAPDPGLRSNATSFWSAFRERLLVARTSEVPDELHFKKSGTEEILEILSSRRKDDWAPPRVVRYEQTYYRLEFSGTLSGPRPFRYTLRRLSTGVPGRSVLIYAPMEVRVVQSFALPVFSVRADSSLRKRLLAPFHLLRFGSTPKFPQRFGL